MSAHYTYSTTRPLYKETAIVTGGSRGIGRAICLALAKAGANIVVNYLQATEQAQETVNDCREAGSTAIAVQADITNPQDVQILLQNATRLGTPSILVNNAGISLTKLFADTTVADWTRVLTNNLTGPFICTQAVLPYMMRREFGRIINISSIWGITGGSCEVAYSAAKGGLISYTKALAKEIARTNITVNAVAPGAIATDMISALSKDDLQTLADETPMGRIGTPEDIASAVLFLALPTSSFITGQVLSPNGGLVT